MQHLLQPTIEIVQAAADVVMSYYQSSYDVKDKSPDNPVTEADFASDALLKERLLALLPEAGWLSEETTDDPVRLDKSLLWCVDPIDGTKEFIMGIPEFTISVALVEDGSPVLAVILNPATKELYHAAKGSGFSFNSSAMQASDRKTLNGARIDASRSERKRGEFEPFEADLTLRTMGSVAYKLARVAAGQCDATWSRGPKHEWDVCAGVLLVQEAGGVAVDLSNRPITFNQSHPKVNGIIADNGHLHAEIAAAIAAIGPARKEAGLTY
ncbi:MAG: 3'(2'),5'-bisphosphate nucleotidase CysQ [Candidatus Promineifilaceae bacterium]